MAPDRPGAGAWCVEQHGIECGAAERRHICNDNVGLKLQPLKIRGKKFQSLGRTIDRSDARAARRKLRRFAAGRGTKIADMQTGRERSEVAPATPRPRPAPTIRHPRSRKALEPARCVLSRSDAVGSKTASSFPPIARHPI